MSNFVNKLNKAANSRSYIAATRAEFDEFCSSNKPDLKTVQSGGDNWETGGVYSLQHNGVTLYITAIDDGTGMVSLIRMD